MSAALDIAESLVTWSVARSDETRPVLGEAVQDPAGWDPDRFAQQQIRGLVQQVFTAGGTSSCRHVVLCGADESIATASLCSEVCREMAVQLQGRICIVEACDSEELERQWTALHDRPAWVYRANTRADFLRVGDSLWLAQRNWLRSDVDRGPVTGLRSRLKQLRSDFDFGLIHAPAACPGADAAILGQLCDGVMLVIEAGVTRRAAALEAAAVLRAAGARLLGTVLTQRRFPIPEKIYRKL